MAEALFDTTVFIDFHRGDPGAQELLSAVLQGQLSAAYSPITVFELWRGRLNVIEERKYTGLLTLMDEASLSSAAGRTAGEWLREETAAVVEAVIRDALIAATAAVRGETIYTRNTGDFTRFYDKVRTY